MMIRTDVIVPEKRIKQHGNRFLKIFVVQQPKRLKKKIVYNPNESADLYIHALTVLGQTQEFQTSEWTKVSQS